MLFKRWGLHSGARAMGCVMHPMETMKGFKAFIWGSCRPGARSSNHLKAGHDRGKGLKPRLLIIHNMVFVGLIGPNRQGTRRTRVRIQPVPIRGFYFLRFHHPIPATDEILTFIIKTNPLENGTPSGVLRGPPLFHGFMTMGAIGAFLIVHGHASPVIGFFCLLFYHI